MIKKFYGLLTFTGWVSTMTSEPLIKERGPDTFSITAEGKDKIIGLR